MKTNKIKDERIVQLNNKIQSEAFILIIAILALSIFIKAYMLDMGVREYLTEMIVMIVSIVYLSIRGAMVGYSSMDNLYFGKKFKVSRQTALESSVSISTIPILVGRTAPCGRIIIL